jgi:hypothetical protein
MKARVRGMKFTFYSMKQSRPASSAAGACGEQFAILLAVI